MHYQENGVWKESQDLLEVAADGGAQAIRGAHQAHFAPNINGVGAIEQVMPSGARLRSHPAGLFLFSPKTGKAVQIAGIKDSIGQLLPPNQLVYPACYDGVAADLRLTYTKEGLESDVILRENLGEIIAAEPDFAGDSTVRLEVWTEFQATNPPRVVPRILQEETDLNVRAGMVEPDLKDDILDFGDLLFMPGRAFSASQEQPRDPQTPARIDLSLNWDQSGLEVARRWLQGEDGRTFLVESVRSSELQRLMAGLPPARAAKRQPPMPRRELMAHLRSPLSPTASPSLDRVQIAQAGSYRPEGVVLDYRDVLTSGPETLVTGETVYVAGTTYLTALTIQPGCVVKYANNAYLLAYSSITSSATSANPALFTSKNDDSIGEMIPGSTGVPTQMANPSLWLYYIPGFSSVSNLRIKWSKIGIKADMNPNNDVTISDSWFEQCGTGISCAGGGGSIGELTLSGVKYCGVSTPTSCSSLHGSMTMDCGTGFAAPNSFSAAERPGAMVLGDLNDDQRPDLVTCSTTLNRITIRLGNVDGTFASATDIDLTSPAGATPSGPALADVNQDLWPDVIVTYPTGSEVKILLGSPTGISTTPLTFPTGSGSVPVAVALGDLDGNFTLDLVVASNEASTGRIRVLLRGASASPTSVTYGAAQSFNVGLAPKSLVLADFDRDGKLDAAVVNETSGTVSLLKGNGPGTFATAVNYNTGAGATRLPRSIVAEDFDLDGFIDIAVANYQSSTVAILRNEPATPGVFAAAFELSTSSGNKPRSLTTADLDGDTWMDLITANENGTSLFSAMRGFGAGAWGTRIDFGATTGSAFVQAGDINRDGRPDVLISNPAGSGSYLVALNTSPLTPSAFATKADVQIGTSADAIVVGRLTTDGNAVIDSDLDVAIATGAGNKVRIYQGDSTGAFPLPPTDLAVPTGTTGPVGLAVGDLDANGYADVVSADYNAGGASHITRWLKSASGAGFGVGMNFGVGMGARALVLGNFNEDPDGKLDAVVANAVGNNLSFLSGNGDGTFATHVLINLNGVTIPQPWALAVGRFNADHRLDLAVADKGAAKVTILTGNGDGSFSGTTHLTAGTSPVSVAVGDFDRNGKDDVVVANEGSNSIKVFLNDGLANFTSLASDTYTTGSQPNGLAVCDVNMDGWIDIVVACKAQAKVQVFPGLGNGKLQTPAQDFTTASQPVAIAIPQLNNDSKPDLVVACATSAASGYISWLMNSQIVIPPVVSFAFPFQKNVNLSKRVGADIESTIAINRANPENIVAISQWNGDPPGGYTRAYSFTGGRTWITSAILTDPVDQFDPSATFDRFGNLHFAYLPTAPTTRIKVRRSIDGGISFEPTDYFSSPINYQGDGDQPKIVVGPGTSSGEEAVWVVFHGGLELAAKTTVTSLGGAMDYGTLMAVAVQWKCTAQNFA